MLDSIGCFVNTFCRSSFCLLQTGGFVAGSQISTLRTWWIQVSFSGMSPKWSVWHWSFYASLELTRAESFSALNFNSAFKWNWFQDCLLWLQSCVRLRKPWLVKWDVFRLGWRPHLSQKTVLSKHRRCPRVGKLLVINVANRWCFWFDSVLNFLFLVNSISMKSVFIGTQ